MLHWQISLLFSFLLRVASPELTSAAPTGTATTASGDASMAPTVSTAKAGLQWLGLRARRSGIQASATAAVTAVTDQKGTVGPVTS